MMKATDFLNQLKRMEESIKNKLEEVAQLKSIALVVTAVSNNVIIDGEKHSADRVQSSGSQQKMADTICKYVDLEKEIDHDIDRLIEKRDEVLAVINALEKPVQCTVLRKKYVQFKSFKRIAEEMNYTYQYIIEQHNKALKNVQKILDF